MTRSPHHEPANLDPVSPFKSGWRKLRPLFEVALRNPAASRKLETCLHRGQLLGQEARNATTPIAVVRALWGMEGLAFARFRRAPDSIEECLRELPREAQTMAHTAIGQTAIVLHGFDAPRVSEFIDSVADRRFRGFSYESLGSVLGLFYPRRFHLLSSVLGKLGIVARVPGPVPSPDTFLEQLPEAGRSLAAHGFGRILCLRSASHRSALRQASQSTDLETAACQSGVAGAYTLVNCYDLPAVLELVDSTSMQAPQPAIRDGVLNALTLVAWTNLGVLQRLAAGNGAASQLVQAALARANVARQQDTGPPWSWE